MIRAAILLMSLGTLRTPAIGSAQTDVLREKVAEGTEVDLTTALEESPNMALERMRFHNKTLRAPNGRLCVEQVVRTHVDHTTKTVSNGLSIMYDAHGLVVDQYHGLTLSIDPVAFHSPTLQR